MPSAVTSNFYLITDVKIGKRYVTVTFFDAPALKILPATYADFYLYANKQLPANDYKKIIEADRINFLLAYAFKVLSQASYSKAQVITKLKAKSATKLELVDVMKRLTKLGYIDDLRFANDYVLQATAKKYGRKRIVDGLKHRGIDDEIINSLKFEPTGEKEKAEAILPKVLLRIKTKNNQQLKDKVYQSYQRLGFNGDVINHILTLIPLLDEESVIANLQVEYAKAHKRYQKKYKGKELTNRVVSYLQQKGYNYSEIIRVIKEDNDDVY